MITDLILSLIFFGLSIACFFVDVHSFKSAITDSDNPIGFVVSILISLLCLALCYLLFKYGNFNCSESAAILCLGVAVISALSVIYAICSSESAASFVVASIVGFMLLLGGIKFFPDIRFENPDCDFQQTKQANKTVEHKSSEETSLPVEQSEQVKQSSNNEVLILDKESKNLYKVDDVTTKQIIELLNKQEQ